jgi:hypothetical protein
MPKKSRDPFNYDPEVAEKMSKLREEDEVSVGTVTLTTPTIETYTYPADDRPYKETAAYATLRADGAAVEDEELDLLREQIQSMQAEINKLTAERNMAIAQVAVLKSAGQVGGLNPDGSLNVMVTIGQDIVLALEPWQEFENMGVVEVIKKHVPLALESYVNGS